MKIGQFILIAAIFLLYPMHVSAEDTLTELWEASGTADGIGTVLSDQGIDLSDPSSFVHFSLSEFFWKIWNQIRFSLMQPLRTAGLLSGVILLSAFAGALKSSKDESISTIYDVLCTLCAVLILMEPLSQCITDTSATLEYGSDFMITFSAIFSAVLTVSGGITTAAAYQGAIILLCQTAMQISAHILVPMLLICLAMSIVDAVNPAVSLAAFMKLIHKSLIWILGIFMSLFIGMLSVQSMVAVSADRFGTKATKFMITSFVPFVGNAVSDAYGTVIGSIHILRSSAGMAGILALIVILLPMIIELALYRMIAEAASAVSELFAASILTRLFRNIESVLAAALSIAVSFSVMFIVSIALMILLTGSLGTT